jgi:dolichyl-phosphate beta-glucosyltransferase
MKGFKDSIANDLFSVSRINGFAFDVEIIYLALKRNYDIKRLPVKLRNQEGTSVSLWRHGVGMVYDLFQIKLNHLTSRYKKNSSGYE